MGLRANKEQRVVQQVSQPMEPIDEGLTKAVDKQTLFEEMRRNGLFRLKSLVSKDTAQQVAQYVDNELYKSQQSLQMNEIKESDHYSESLAASDSRFDFKLPMNDLLMNTMKSLLKDTLLGDALELLATDEAELLELACFITKNSAMHQILHSDTLYSEKAVTYTCFIALQDINDEMGPTIFIPKSHTAKFHKQFDSSKPSKRLKLIEGMDIKRALLDTGSCVVYDSRLHHCGTANHSSETRRIFYFSFSSPKGISADDDDFEDFWNVASIRDNIKGKFKLKDFR